jgi:hypothetical protein
MTVTLLLLFWPWNGLWQASRLLYVSPGKSPYGQAVHVRAVAGHATRLTERIYGGSTCGLA